jgi:hypothetical protein
MYTIVCAVVKEPAVAVPLAEAAKALTAQAPASEMAKRKSVKCTQRREKAKRETAKRKKTKKEKTPHAKTTRAFLWAKTIFANERRPAITEVVRAKGGPVNPTDIDDQIDALWQAETDKEKYEFLEAVSKERYINDHVLDGAPALDVAKKRAATPKERAASCEDAAQVPPAVPTRCALKSAIASMCSYAGNYLQPFLLKVGDDHCWVDPEPVRNQRTRWAALRLLAAGSGPLRVPTCAHALRVASGETDLGQALLRRALLFLGPGELEELHEMRSDEALGGTFDFMLSMLEQEAAECRLQGGDAPRDAPVSRVLASLRVIKGENSALPPALIRHFAATLTELESYDVFVRAPCALSSCTLLESLTFHNWDWDILPPAAWLGLSQLHTLRGVSLFKVPAATIAAALPRLHTLHLNHTDDIYDRVGFPVAPFFNELLPRLRSFHLDGEWPKSNDQGTEMANVPLLEDLKWCSWEACFGGVPRQLMGARPATLSASHETLVKWLKAADGVRADSSTVISPLACVRALTLKLEDMPPDAACMARLLRAAPQLRQLTIAVFYREHALVVFSDEFISEPAFTGLVHPRLRHVAFSDKEATCNDYRTADMPVPFRCGIRLRRHFPRLRRLTVGDEEYPVWAPRWSGRRKTF